MKSSFWKEEKWDDPKVEEFPPPESLASASGPSILDCRFLKQNREISSGQKGTEPCFQA